MLKTTVEVRVFTTRQVNITRKNGAAATFYEVTGQFDNGESDPPVVAKFSHADNLEPGYYTADVEFGVAGEYSKLALKRLKNFQKKPKA